MCPAAFQRGNACQHDPCAVFGFFVCEICDFHRIYYLARKVKRS